MVCTMAQYLNGVSFSQEAMASSYTTKARQGPKGHYERTPGQRNVRGPCVDLAGGSGLDLFSVEYIP